MEPKNETVEVKPQQILHAENDQVSPSTGLTEGQVGPTLRKENFIAKVRRVLGITSK